MDPDPTTADALLERIEAMLSGLTLPGDERAIVATGRVRLLVLDPDAQVAGAELSFERD